MPNIKSAKKELRKGIKRADFNRKIKENLKALLKKSRKAVAAKDSQAKDFVSEAIKALDKAAQKGIIKKNTCNRKKSRLHKLFNQKIR